MQARIAMSILLIQFNDKFAIKQKYFVYVLERIMGMAVICHADTNIWKLLRIPNYVKYRSRYL